MWIAFEHKNTSYTRSYGIAGSYGASIPTIRYEDYGKYGVYGKASTIETFNIKRDSLLNWAIYIPLLLENIKEKYCVTEVSRLIKRPNFKEHEKRTSERTWNWCVPLFRYTCSRCLVVPISGIME